MHKAEMEAKLLELIRKHGVADVLNEKFVDDVIAAFQWPYRPTNWGAHKCPRLGKELARLWRCNILERRKVSLIEHEYGFPNWVYSYTVKGEELRVLPGGILNTGRF